MFTAIREVIIALLLPLPGSPALAWCNTRRVSSFDDSGDKIILSVPPPSPFNVIGYQVLIQISPVDVSVLSGAEDNTVPGPPFDQRDGRNMPRKTVHLSVC